MRSSIQGWKTVWLALWALPALGAGTIQGVVTYAGTPPKRAVLDTGGDTTCGDKPLLDESLLVSTKHGLKDVLVRVKDAPVTATPPAADVAVDQKHCTYSPHVQGAVEGQKLAIHNDDPSLHNVHAYAGMRGLFNVAQPPGLPVVEKPVPAGTDVVHLKCDVHPWMSAYVVYGKSPYFTVTHEDGAFEIKGVPAGTYTLEAWQERLGTRSVQVTVKDAATAKVKVEFRATSGTPAPEKGG